MAEIDTSIYGRLQPVQQPDQLGSLAKLYQMQAMQQQAQMGGLQQEKFKRDLAKEGELQTIARSAGGDQGRLAQLLYERGYFGEGAKIQEGARKIALDEATIGEKKAQTTLHTANAAEKKIGEAKSKLAYVRELATRVVDEPTFQSFKQALANSGMDLSQTPANFSPEWKNNFIMTAAEQAKQLSPVMKEVNDGQRTTFVDVNPVTNPAIAQFAAQMKMTPAQVAQDGRALQQIAESQRHNRVSEGISGGHLSLARQKEARERDAPKGQYDPERGLLIDPRTGTASPVTQGGAPIGPKDKQPTESELSSAGYAGRMQRAESIITRLPGTADRESLPEQAARSFGQDTTANVIMSSSRQQYRQAQEDWVRAKLRKESGAVIAKDEMDREIATYFPLIGDLPPVVAQKAQARAQAVEQLRSSSSRAKIPGNVDNRPDVGSFGAGGRPPIGSFER